MDEEASHGPDLTVQVSKRAKARHSFGAEFIGSIGVGTQMHKHLSRATTRRSGVLRTRSTTGTRVLSASCATTKLQSMMIQHVLQHMRLWIRLSSSTRMHRCPCHRRCARRA